METKYIPGPWVYHSKGSSDSGVEISAGPIEIGFGRWGHMTDEYVISRDQMEATGDLISAAPDLLDALISITSNPHIDLGDLIYKVRESEGNGWDGQAVKQWSDAIDKVKNAINKATGKQ